MYLPKIKTSNTKHNQETLDVHYNSDGLHIFVLHFYCMGLGTEMLDMNTQPVMAKVTDIFASNRHNLVKKPCKYADVQFCIGTGQIRDICILTAPYPFFGGFRGHNRHSRFGAGTHSVSTRHLYFAKSPPFMTFRNSDGVGIHLATAK